MLIRIFGITTPIGDHLYKKVLKNLYGNINCYSRSNKKYKFLDLRNIKHPNLKKECNSEEIWIFLCPIWEIVNFLDNLINEKNYKKFQIKGIICCSSTSVITKKYSWHSYDKKLVSIIISAEQNIMKICSLNKTSISIIRPTLIYGNSGSYKDKNINQILKICKKLPFIILPKETGERQPLHISQLAEIINNEVKLITYTKDKSQQSILNIGGDEILSYEMILKSLLLKRKIKKSIFSINSHFFLLFFSPLLIINSRLYSEILRIRSDLSGFQKSNIYLKNPPKKFIDFI
ncbi:MAG: hypothetical protein CMC78_05415 [Flavobacteriaceae bacterium]|nr:hypothetical protein [Flavobacteriaceae bacterium]